MDATAFTQPAIFLDVDRLSICTCALNLRTDSEHRNCPGGFGGLLPCTIRSPTGIRASLLIWQTINIFELTLVLTKTTWIDLSTVYYSRARILATMRFSSLASKLMKQTRNSLIQRRCYATGASGSEKESQMI